MHRWLVLTLFACGDQGSHFQCEPKLELSDGLGGEETAFVALEPGGTVVIEHGSQGGNHVYFGGRVSGPGPGLTVHGRVFDNRTGALIGGASADSTQSLEMQDFDDCTGTFRYARSILGGISNEELCDLEGASLRLEAEVVDFDGEILYSGVGRSNGAALPDPDASASVEVVGTLSEYVRDCFCGGTSGDTGGCYY